MTCAKPLGVLIFATALSTFGYAQLGGFAQGIADAQQRDLERQHQLQMQREAEQTALEIVRIQAQSQAAQKTPPSPSQAFYYESGSAFLRDCATNLEKHAQATPLTNAEVSMLNECAGFLRGFNEGINLGVQFSAGATKIQLSQPWCTPETGSDVQLGLVLVKYIRAHPETAHLRTTVLASLAYFEAFPCKMARE
jgi:hypothetical protein